MLYRTEPDSKGRVHEVRIRTITRPTKTRTLRVAGGRRKFTAVAVKREVREFILYAPASTKPISKSSKEYYKHMGKNKGNKATDVTDDDLKELESLEDLDDAADEAPTADEAPVTKKGKKGKKGNKAADEATEEAPKKKRSGGAAPGESRAAANGKIGTAEIAAKGGTDARTLRMVLRKHSVPKNPETNRYEWDSWDDKAVKNILKLLKGGEAENVKKEGLQRLKDSKEAKDAAAKTESGDSTSKKDKKKGKKNKNK